MNLRWPSLIIFYALVLLISFAGAWLALSVKKSRGGSVAGKVAVSPPSPRSAAREHGHLGENSRWIYQQLQLTPEQVQRLHGAELEFARQEARLERLTAEEQDKLGQMIRDHRVLRPEMQRSLEVINGYRGELQQLTLRHLFDIYTQLDPKRQEQLLELSAASLEDPLANLSHHPEITGVTPPLDAE